MKTFIDVLNYWDACDTGMSFARQVETPEAAWDACPPRGVAD
jgi:hypothetical protein